MTEGGRALLIDPPQRGHIVYPYVEDELLCEAAVLFVSAGLTRGEAALVIVANHHRRVMDRLLLEMGFDVPAMVDSEQITYIDANRSLDTLMEGSIPDEEVFGGLVGSLISRSKDAGNGRVRVVGEMVDLLARRDRTAARRLERLWNSAVAREGVSLLCPFCLGSSKHSAVDSGALPKMRIL